MAQRIQTTILQDFRQTFGVDAMLPEEVATNLILQVTSENKLFTCFFFHSNFNNYNFFSDSNVLSINLRACIRSRLDVSCRRLQQYTKMKDSPEFTLHVQEPILNPSLISSRPCLQIWTWMILISEIWKWGLPKSYEKKLPQLKMLLWPPNMGPYQQTK